MKHLTEKTKLWGLPIFILAITTFVSCKDDDPVLSGENQLTAFKLLFNDNEQAIDSDYEATSIGDDYVEMELPTNTDLSQLTPQIAISLKATINPASGTPQDFSQGAITYTVIAENGNQQKYNVSISTIDNSLKTDKEALLALFNANPDNTLGWDVNTAVTAWEGVTVEDVDGSQRVTQLECSNKGIATLPEEMGLLDKVTFMDVAFNNIALIPDEVSNMGSLNYAIFDFNSIEEVQSGFEELKNLEYLYLTDNALTSLPAALANLPLKELDVSNNPMKCLPNAIWDNTANYDYFSFDNTCMEEGDVNCEAEECVLS